jgi:myosin heavy subunit
MSVYVMQHYYFFVGGESSLISQEDPNNVDDADDLVQLFELTESTILDNLRSRYSDKKIYVTINELDLR